MKGKSLKFWADQCLVRIFPVKKAGGKYWLVEDKSQGKRRLLSHTSEVQAREKAQAIADFTLKGQPEFLNLDLHAIVDEWKLVNEALRGRGSIVDAVRYYMTNGGPELIATKVQQAVDEFLALKEAQKISAARVYNLKCMLAKLTAVHGEEVVHTLTVAKMGALILGLNLGANTQNAYRKVFIGFFGFCQTRNYVARDYNPAKSCGRATPTPARVSIFTPADMKKVVAACTADLADHLSWVVLCGFAGLRPSEAARLNWVDVHQDFIDLRANVCKKVKKDRTVPILPNLKAWLDPMRQKSGKVVPAHIRMGDAPGVVAKAAGVKWDHDILRHSYASYRQAVIRNAPQLVEEMGNSIAIAKKHYLKGLIKPEQGAAWFAIVPEGSEKITPLVAVV